MKNLEFELSNQNSSINNPNQQQEEIDGEECHEGFQRVNQTENDGLPIVKGSSSSSEDEEYENKNQQNNYRAITKLKHKTKSSKKLIKKTYRISKKWIRNNWNLTQSIICHCLMGISFFLFVNSIEQECNSEEYPSNNQCVEKIIRPHIKDWVIKIFVSTLCVYIQFMLVFYGNFKKLYSYLAALLAIYLQFIHHGVFFSFGQISVRKYQAAQSILWTLFFVLEILITLFIIFLIYMVKRQKIILGVSIFLLIAYLLYIKAIINSSCDQWENGLNGKLDFEKPFCEIQKPKYCWPELLQNKLDLSKGKKCEKSYKNEESLQFAQERLRQKYKKQGMVDIKYLAWPLPQEIEKNLRTSEVKLMEEYIKNSVQVQNPEEAFALGKEVVIDIEKLQMHIKVSRNERIANQRAQIQNNDYISKNIIAIYIDTVSRAQSLRQLKNTMKYLKKFGSKDKNMQENKSLFEFFRFHALNKNSVDNLFPLQFDTIQEQLAPDQDNNSASSSKSLIHEFQDAGFVVGHATNIHGINSISRTFQNSNVPSWEFQEDQPADHEFFLFDPDFIDSNNPLSFKNGPFSIYRRCLYNHDTNYYPLQYGLQFLDAYREEKKVLYMEFSDGQEITSEVLKYMDDNLLNFFKQLEERNYLQKDTMVYLFSNHGQHLIQNFNFLKQSNKFDMFTEVYQTERMLPMFYMMITNDLISKYSAHSANAFDNQGNLSNDISENNNDLDLKRVLKHNQQPIFGMRQVRNTLIANVQGMGSSAALNSLFYDLDNKKNCLNLGIPSLANIQELCVCKPRKN